MKNYFENKQFSPWAVLLVSFLAMILVIQILSWQYRKMEREDISNLEERIEMAAARETLKDFLGFRIAKNENQAKVFLTERSVEQLLETEAELVDNFVSFEIFEEKREEENSFNFLVKISTEGRTDFIEKIKVVKILGKYYIDSIEIPG
jgi:hypothetical protein